MPEETAILAGGCFWGAQQLLRRRPGVLSTRVGYSGDDATPNATYRRHGDHAESVEVVFDPTVIPYREILEFFFQIHDPSTRDRQGNDRGRSYRSAIFFTSDEQRRVALDTIADVDASAGEGRHRGRAGRRVLAGRGGAPGLPGEGPLRLHVPLRAAGLEAAAPRAAARVAPQQGRDAPSGTAGGRVLVSGCGIRSRRRCPS